MSEQTDCAQSKPMTAAQLKRLRNGLPDGCPLHSPWGAVQHGEKLADGVFFVSTAGHGGIKLDRARNALIPDVFRREGGWYEEDCDWAIPMYFLELKLEKKELALETMRNWHWRAYESWFKETIPPGSSYLKDEHLFQEANRANWVVISAVRRLARGGSRGHGRLRRHHRRPSWRWPQPAPSGAEVPRSGRGVRQPRPVWLRHR